MKILKLSFILIGLLLSLPALAFPDDNLSSALSGKILLDVENGGEAWYVYPGDFHRYYLGSPVDAYNIMRNLSLGISNENFLNISNNIPDRFKGLILIKPEDFGKAYYINPETMVPYYLANPASAFDLMRKYSLGITSADLKRIPIGKIILDENNKEISREWQYLGWWSKVNKNIIPVMEEPKSDSRKLGSLFLNNTVKVLGIEKNNGRVWYKIDGGQYPGAFVDAAFISPISQPTPNENIVPPSEIKDGEYWIDVDLSKKVLTLLKQDQVVMATYISPGNPLTPTIIGTYRVWLKLEKTRMTGAPPLATHVYDLPNVPWVMYYKGSFAIHGTYWHDDFGSQRSSGCTNVTQGDAKYLFDLTDPKMFNLASIHSTLNNPGVLVFNHY